MPPETTVPISNSHVTPTNTSHSLFGKVFTVVREGEEWVEAELKDAVHDIVVFFKKKDVTAALPASAASESTSTAPETVAPPQPAPSA